MGGAGICPAVLVGRMKLGFGAMPGLGRTLYGRLFELHFLNPQRLNRLLRNCFRLRYFTPAAKNRH
jgi:hypothetical protein